MGEDPPQTVTAQAVSTTASHRRWSLFDWLRGCFCKRSEGDIREAIEDAIDEVLEEHEGDPNHQLAPEEQAILRNALGLGQTTAHDIMTPRPYISSVPVTITLDALKKHIVEQAHTRIPVYRDTLDQIEGFIHIKDLFPIIAGDAPFDIHRVMRPMLFVPPSMRITELLRRMRRQATHMAIVVDEYGGTDGLLTLEDMFEELVGDIQDEHDGEEEPRDLARISDGVFEVDARLRVERLESALNISLVVEEEEGDYDTVGGLLFFTFGHVPVRGEVITHPSGVDFEIMEADARRIRRVRVKKPE